LPSAGAPCLHPTGQPDLPDAPLCAVGAYCTKNDSCADLPAIGEPCSTSTDLNGRDCVAGARCDGGTCVAPTAIGQACQLLSDSDDQGDCVDGATCACTNQRCDPPGICLRLMEEGGPCTATNVHCANGTRCDNGTCVAVASQGLAEAAAQACAAMSM
jgi:hypothetical protein